MKIRMLRNEIFKELRLLRLFVVIAFGLTNVFSILTSYIMGQLLDSINKSWNLVIALGLIAVVCIILSFILNWCQNYLWFRMIHKGIAMFRCKLFEYIMRNPFSFFVNSKTGDIVNRILNDAAQYAEQTLIAMPMLIINTMTLCLVYGFVVLINYKIAFLLVLLSIAYFLSYRHINIKLRQFSSKERKRYSDLMNCASNYYEGISTIKLFRREREFTNLYRDYVQNLCRQAISLQKWKSLSLCVSSMVIDIMPVCVIVMGVYYVMQGSCTVGSLFSIYACISALGEPIRNLTDYNLMIQSGRVNEKRLEELLCEENKLGEINIFGIDSITVTGMEFAYGTDAQIIRDINLRVKRGEVIGIVGSSGGGKSTFLRILTGELRPTKGNVLVNDIPIESIAYSSYLRRIAVMPQNVFLYEDSILNNIVFERKIPDDKLDSLIEILNIKDYIDRNISELSGGEKRRVGLARALVGEFDLLILDEPTSDIDIDMEKRIIKFIANYVEKNNIILLVVTHREAILSICDNVLRI